MSESSLQTGTARRPWPETLRQSVTLWGATLSARDSSPWWIRLRAWNRLLAIVLVAGAAATALQLTRPLSVDPRSAPGSAGSGDLDAASVVTTSPGDAITFDPARLFRGPPARAPRSTPRSNVTLSELSRQLTLVGILGGDPPQAIIFNQRANQTVYVPPGDFVGEIKVQEVRRSSVVLSWKNETLELVL